MPRIGIIGGSGLYQIEGIKQLKKLSVSTPFGKPSDKFTVGKLEGETVAFLPRHGVGHRILPSEINYRANIYAMKKLGVERIISVSACGSLKEELRPLDFVLPDQFVDRTNQARATTFFGDGVVAHIAFSEPVCAGLAKVVYDAAKEVKASIHLGGAYINMEGPQFSTKAESNLYRQWGMDIIGMTNIAEAKLAREAEICYVTLAAITDYDCWRESEEAVTIDMVIQNLLKNTENAKRILKAALPRIGKERKCACMEALKYAIVTPGKVIPPKTKKKLDLIIGQYIK